MYIDIVYRTFKERLHGVLQEWVSGNGNERQELIAVIQFLLEQRQHHPDLDDTGIGKLVSLCSIVGSTTRGVEQRAQEKRRTRCKHPVWVNESPHEREAARCVQSNKAKNTGECGDALMVFCTILRLPEEWREGSEFVTATGRHTILSMLEAYVPLVCGGLRTQGRGGSALSFGHLPPKRDGVGPQQVSAIATHAHLLSDAKRARAEE